MKLDNFNTAEIVASEDLEGQDYGIAAEGMGLAIRAFTQYSRPIESVVREVTSNCQDAHKEAEMIPRLSDEEINELGYTGDPAALRDHFSKWTNQPVEVEFALGAMGMEERSIIFRDFGVGISPSRMKRIMTKFFSSTKRSTNELIGAFGLGSKSPLGYTDSFGMTTWFFGVKYEYLIHMGAEAPRLEVLGKEEDPDHANGTEVIVPIESYSDVEKFKKAVKEQLRYFDNINVIGYPEYSDAGIYRGEHFIYKDDGHMDEMHICLGQVYYPIDWSACHQIRYSGKDCPIALYFDIGELPIVWNRESIEYTDEAVEKIKDRLVEAKAEMQEIHDASFDHIKTAKEYLLARGSHMRNELRLTDDVAVPQTRQLVDHNIKWPKYTYLMKDPYYFFNVEKMITNGKTSTRKYIGMPIHSLVSQTDHPKYGKFFFSWEGNSRYNINKWLNEDKDYDEFYLISPSNQHPDGVPLGEKTWDQQTQPGWAHWQVENLDNKEWSEDIAQEILDQVNEIFEEILSVGGGTYDDLEVPEDFKERQRAIAKAKREKRKKAKKGKVKEAGDQKVTMRKIFWEGWHGNEPTYHMWGKTLKNIYDHRGTIVYADQEDDELLHLASALVENAGLGGPNNPKVSVVKVAIATKDIMKPIPQCVPVREFLDPFKNGMIRRVATAKMIAEHTNIGGPKYKHWDRCYGISRVYPYYQEFLRLKEYQRNNLKNPSLFRVVKGFDTLVQQIIKQRLYDHQIIESLRKFVAANKYFRILKFVDLDTIPKDDMAWILGMHKVHNPRYGVLLEKADNDSESIQTENPNNS